MASVKLLILVLKVLLLVMFSSYNLNNFIKQETFHAQMIVEPGSPI